MLVSTPINLLNSGLLDGASVHKVCDIILSGRCVILPTETGYMMAVNALNTSAVESLYYAKRRPFSNPIHVAVASLRQAERLVRFSQKAYRLADGFLPGALTIISPKRTIVSDLLVANTGNLGTRIPNMPVIIQIAAALELPLTATSTNLAAEPPFDDVDAIMGTFPDYIAAIVSKPVGFEFLNSSTTVRVIGDPLCL